MDDIAVARALHVASVWIGGVTMVTTVFLPTLRRGAFGDDWLTIFHRVEHRFIWIARAMALIAGATGFYIVTRLDLWERFASARFWWMHAMLGLWLIFMMVLFVFEPLVLRRYFPSWAHAEPGEAFAWLQRGHLVLLVMAYVTILGAVAGAHRWWPL